jgi:hypothetical protein
VYDLRNEQARGEGRVSERHWVRTGFDSRAGRPRARAGGATAGNLERVQGAWRRLVRVFEDAGASGKSTSGGPGLAESSQPLTLARLTGS